jgi:secreted PhoX family phosphatase
VKNSKGLVLVASTKKIIAIISLTLLLIPVSNVFAFSNGQAATVAVGQPNLTTGAAGTAVAALSGPFNSAFDSSGNLWVTDFANNRVLKYNAPITTGESASVVIGQTSFTTNTFGTTATTLRAPNGISFDPAGNLWVVDQNNNRVLEYLAPITTGEAASVVIGQTSFTTNTFGTTATGLGTPFGISFDPAGNLWVTDASNNRVLKYLAPITTGEAAILEIGQASLTGPSATTLFAPSGISFDPAGNLWVVDKGSNRVLEYLAPITGGEAATTVIGQASFNTDIGSTGAATLFAPSGISFDPAGNLWVTDYSSNRVLEYAAPITTGETASVVIGQTGLAINTFGTTATTLHAPIGISFDSVGNLWVVDTLNNRVLEFSATITQVTGQLTVLSGTCGINVVSGTPLNYGSVISGSVSTEQTVVLQNTGTVPGTLAVHGTDWLDGSSTSQMLVGSTKFSATTGTYLSKTALTTGDLPVGTILPTPNLSTFWQVQATPISPTFGGTLTQTVTFSNSC